jgi:hypothetical protein
VLAWGAAADFALQAAATGAAFLFNRKANGLDSAGEAKPIETKSRSSALSDPGPSIVDPMPSAGLISIIVSPMSSARRPCITFDVSKSENSEFYADTGMNPCRHGKTEFSSATKNGKHRKLCDSSTSVSPAFP